MQVLIASIYKPRPYTHHKEEAMPTYDVTIERTLKQCVTMTITAPTPEAAAEQALAQGQTFAMEDEWQELSATYDVVEVEEEEPRTP
jgi:hypothetical protein